MKAVLQLTAVLCLSAYIHVAWAHGEKVAYPLGSAASGAAATDVWYITCTKGPEKPGAPIVTPTRLAFRVQDLSPPLHPAKISVKASKAGFPVTPSYTDATDGNNQYDTGSATVFHSLYGGAGVYSLSVTKSLSTVKGAERYKVQFHCWNNATGHSTIKCTKTGVGAGRPLC